MSLSARRAWIEIDFTGSDWVSEFVALRKESVDRNTNFSPASLFDLVALRKESVDRNSVSPIDVMAVSASLSARRAWIEILSAVLTELLILGRSPQGERG